MNKNNIQIKYFIVAICFGCIVVAIFTKASYISFVEGNIWRHMGDSIGKRPNIEVTAPRGNIYSDDEQLMATTEYSYRLYIDFWADGLKGDTLKKYVSPLSIELNKLFPEKPISYYQNQFMSGWKMKENEESQIKRGKKISKRSREYRLLDGKMVNYLELKKIQKMPFLCQNKNKSGLITKPFVKRTKPFGTLASRTIGDIYGEFEKGGKNGLELEYDSLLRGIPGTSTRRKVNGRIINVIDIDPIPGKDIISTINIHIQDITEKALLDKLQEIDAESGTAVVMEVATGEIKAITNMGRFKEGVWTESKNFAVADQSEPGSTFKVASMMVALEDGVITPEDSIETGNGLYPYAGSVVRDHNAHKGGYGKISAAQTIWYSSNVGVAKIILKGYKNNPEKYVEGLYKIGFNKDLELEIPGSGKAKIRSPKDSTRYWSVTTLPWMSFGYETQIPPIYTLTFFNAIANNGKMIKPIFVKEIRQNGEVEERKQTKVINEQICSQRTLEQIQEMLLNVVENGTGEPVKSPSLKIAGKTGTAQLSQGAAGYTAGGKSHQVSFCGYFPADKPMYSCIVVIRKPRNGYPSGGTMAGGVCRRIAEEVYSKTLSQKPQDCIKDSLAPTLPFIKSGLFSETKYILNKLDIPYNNDSLDGKWFVSYTRKDEDIVLKDRKIIDNLVPNVVGMGAKDAIYLLENSGLKVNLLGRGTVFAQSINSGARAVKGQTIAIQLR